jgi:hypothetical protein
VQPSSAGGFREAGRLQGAQRIADPLRDVEDPRVGQILGRIEIDGDVVDDVRGAGA